ncbi:GNAT family N-acetyltransferase [Rugamonas rubra]|uniref:Protein N-acetyltransferase, RimJ/RimL family n=1 Tax=Rugamonas rubra TaxID=758825 RepID=A0A1I4JSZ7_9BURK|nr:GNAT family N-acetyltransferase [Rugamonas rubra]SFL69708.1 Protein N-acetyltransferase, RimJ/RimL family [Rugamonas rubra]
MHILDTERLTLRTIEVDDAAFYLELVNDPSWLRYIGDRNIRTLEQSRAYIEQVPCAMQRELGHSMYVIELKDGGAAIGMCGLIKRDTLPDVDIGYAIRPAWWGRGFAYEAAAAVLAYGRDRVGLKRLLGITNPDNIVSNRLLQKLGLALVETTILGAEQRPTNLYRLEFAAAPA